ncbi:MAG TPA: hypothetical protein DCZ94_15770 [Lentisphaeria bacterium]|nr:MAG: hypothetical protein A2X48_18665 [Lentisphaerae bacterium GWF2_49_21]HBC88407.1 hypothetical protein [Lentisphaeria bacterium]
MNEMTQHFLLSQSVPTLILWIGTILLFAAWIRLRPWSVHGTGWMTFVSPAVRALVCFIALLVAAQAFQRHLIFATTWAIWLILLVGAISTEIVLVLYAFECQTVRKREGKIIRVLRALLVLLVTFALCQPVRSFEVSRKIDRYVVVAVDNSASMDIADTGMGLGERIRLAEYLSVLKTKRPFRSEETVSVLDQARQELSAQMDGLVTLSQISAGSGDQTVEKLKPILGSSRSIRKNVAAQPAKLNEVLALKSLVLADQVKGRIDSASKRISSETMNVLDERIKLLEAAIQSLGKKSGDKDKIVVDYNKILDTGKRAIDSLQVGEKEIAVFGDEIDQALYKSIPEAERTAIDALTALKRSDLAAKILTTPPGSGTDAKKSGSIIQRISDSYGMKAYAFAVKPTELDQQKLLSGKMNSADETGHSQSSMGTNISGVLGKAMSDIPAGQLAGILLLSDGRHNASEPLETIAARLGQARIPVCSLAFGNDQRPPKDAAVVSADAPDMLFINDSFKADVDVKLDNLSGKKISVKLLDGANIVDTRNIDVKADSLRERILLSDKPKTVGYHSYKVQIDAVEGEVEKGNNELSIPANVTDDRIKVLYVESYPRWEFRYLKNLFVSRDQSVRLQYVILKPDTIDNIPAKQAVSASASRPVEEPEATRLPANDEEWMKFDVIILGDVDPAAIGAEGIKSLKKFVAERGGALIMVAGSGKMPRSFSGTQLEEIIPVSFKASDVPFIKAPEESYRIALTQEGREHVITRLSQMPNENAKVWNELPSLYWRHPISSAKPGAAVLAYAMPFEAPAFLKPRASNEVPDEETLKMRRQFELENALIVCQNYALGRVAMLTFDESWRLRYREGDTYHHKFWGQLLRWATADKILFGSSCIKIAADKSRYSPDENVRVRAKITRRDFSPVTGLSPSIRVMNGEKEVSRKKLKFETNSAGIYSGDIGRLPEGGYKLILECPGLPEDMAPELAAARAEFGVAASSPAELVELTADMGALNRLATLTGGAVVEPPMARTAMEKFGPPSLIQTERRQVSIWNSWPFMLLLIGLAVGEWLLRKRVNLP